MKTLYFDINGTLTYEYVCKPALAGGVFETEVRAARFERLVCVSSFQKNIEFLMEMGKNPDPHAILFDACFGAFADPVWFRSVTTLAADSSHRGRSIDRSGDWWYADDRAEEYLVADGLADVFFAHNGGRIFVPRSNSDGADVITWLRSAGASLR